MPIAKLEGEIILQSATAVGTFNASAITMPAGRYFLNSAAAVGGTGRSFLDELEFQVTTALGGVSTFTVADDTDTSTGVVTLARSVATSVTWTSATIRDLLGFTGNLGAATSHTGTRQAKYLWLPNCGRSGAMAPEASDGAIDTDYTFAMSSDGTAYPIAYSQRFKDTMEFRTVKGSKAWIASESTVNESFERFYRDTIAYGLKIRYHADRSVDGTYRTWVVEDGGQYAPQAIVENWTNSAHSLWGFRYMVRKAT